jgi:hypothetical protein
MRTESEPRASASVRVTGGECPASPAETNRNRIRAARVSKRPGDNESPANTPLTTRNRGRGFYVVCLEWPT